MLLHGLAPHKGLLVGFGLYFCAVDVLHVKSNEAFVGQHKHHLCEDVVHVCIEDDFEHHLRMVRTTAFLMVKFLELSQVKALDYRIDYAHRIVFSDILVEIHCQKQSFVILQQVTIE